MTNSNPQEREHEPDLQRRVERLEVAVGELRQLLQQLLAQQPERDSFQADLPQASAGASISQPEADFLGPNLLGEDLPVVLSSSPTGSPGEPRGPASITTPAAETVPRGRSTPAASQSSNSQSSNSQGSKFLESLQNWEFWLNRLGIGLLLLGVGFLFKYSIDQGWLTPAVRVGFGLALGLVLLGLGLRLTSRRRAFSQILLGGSIATFYITGFAAFQFLKLIPYPLAMAFMIAVTLLSFGLSLWQGQAVLSVLGLLGGLGTPFMLYNGPGNVAALMGYTCLLLAGAGAIYWRQGWRSLLWTAFVGGWLVLSLGLLAGWSTSSGFASGDRWVLQLSGIFTWCLFAPLPIARELFVRKLFVGRHSSTELSTESSQLTNEASTPDTGSTPNSSTVTRPLKPVLLFSLELLTVLTPLLLLLYSRGLWNLRDATWGWIAIAVAGFYGLAGQGLQSRVSSLGYTHLLVCFFLLATGLVWLLEGDWLFLMLTAEAVVLHLLARQLGNRKLRVAAHLLSAALGLRLWERYLGTPVTGTPVWNLPGFTELIVTLVGAGITRWLTSRGSQRLYLGIAHLSFLVWLLRQLSPLENGAGFVTLSWGVYGIGLLVLGLRRDLGILRWAGMTTLLLVVLKLFFFDLIGLEPIWRILLFMGFGVVFLVLSYSFRSLWRKPQTSSELGHHQSPTPNADPPKLPETNRENEQEREN